MNVGPDGLGGGMQYLDFGLLDEVRPIATQAACHTMKRHKSAHNDLGSIHLNRGLCQLQQAGYKRSFLHLRRLVPVQ